MLKILGGASHPKYIWRLDDTIDSITGALAGTFTYDGTNRTRINPDTGEVETIGANTPRFEDVGGYEALLLEPAGVNLIQYSHEFENAWWGRARMTSITANGMLAPDGNTVADGLVADGDDDAHYISTPLIPGISQNDKVAGTIFGKIGNEDWIYLRIRFYDVADGALGDEGNYYFDIANGLIGAVGEVGNTTVHAYMIEEVANGFYRIGLIVSNADASTAKVRFYVHSAHDDNDNDFAGNTVDVNTWLWGADIKIQPYFDSHIETSGDQGADLVMDGVMEAVTLGSELHIDANAASDPYGNEADDTAGWNPFGLDVGVNIFDSVVVAGDTGNWSIEANTNDTPTDNSLMYKNIGTDWSLVVGKAYRITFDTRHVGVAITNGDWKGRFAANQWLSLEPTDLLSLVKTDVTFQSVSWDFTYDLNHKYFGFREDNDDHDGGIYLDNLSCKPITFTSYNDDADGLAPGTDGAGALIDKANWDGSQVAESALTQAGAVAEADKNYLIEYTVTRDAGEVQIEFGSTNGTSRGAAGTYFENVIASNAGYLRIKADADFIGTVDDIVVKETGTVRLTESGYPIWTRPTNLFDAEGTCIVWVRFGYVTADVPVYHGIVSCRDSHSSVLRVKSDGSTIESRAAPAGGFRNINIIANTWYKLVVKWGYSGKLRVGVDIGSGVVWGVEVDFDGSYILETYLRLGYKLFGSMYMRQLMLFRKALTDTMINHWTGSP